MSVVVVVAGLFAYSALSGGRSTTSGIAPTTSSGTTTPSTGNAQLVLPITGGNPIVNNAVAPGFIIASAIVENNTDPVTKLIVSDHLEVALKNTGTQDITNFETYYSVKDLVSKVSDAYYTKLTGFVLKVGETKTFHFDNTSKTNHYPENKYSLYRTSKNAMQFDLMVSTPTYKPQTITIKKDKGGAEKVD